MPEIMSPSRSHGLVEILDRVLDKGLVIAGDIKINLANVELLTIQIRLLVCSIDKAEAIGLNWWRTDPRLSVSGADRAVLGAEGPAIEARLARMEEKLSRLTEGGGRKRGSRSVSEGATTPKGERP